MDYPFHDFLGGFQDDDFLARGQGDHRIRRRIDKLDRGRNITTMAVWLRRVSRIIACPQGNISDIQLLISKK